MKKDGSQIENDIDLSKMAKNMYKSKTTVLLQRNTGVFTNKLEHTTWYS